MPLESCSKKDDFAGEDVQNADDHTVVIRALSRW